MIPSKNILLTRVIQNKDGEIIKAITDQSHSWTRNAYNVLVSQMTGALLNNSSFGSGYLSIKNTSGTVRYSSSYICEVYSYYGASGNSSYGIVIGTSDVGFSFNNYNLGSIINHGNGSGQMTYLSSTAVRTNNYEDFKLTLTRKFCNNSGGSITVKEIGLIARVIFASTGYLEYALFIRDVLSSSDIVPYGGQYTVTYEITSNLPE